MSPDRLAIAQLTSLAAVDAIAADWRWLEREATQPSLFQSFAWCRVVMERLIADGYRGRPWIITLRHADRLLAVAPFCRFRLGPVRLATALGEPLAQYADVLAAVDAPWAADALLAFLRRERSIDCLTLRRVRSDAAVGSALGTQEPLAGERNIARHAELSGAGSMQAFAESVDPKATRDRARLKRRLMAQGNLEFVHLAPGRQAKEATELAIRWKRQWLAERNMTSAAFATRRWMELAATLVAEAAAGSHTTMAVLDGEPAAIEVGFRHGGRHYAFLGAARPGLDRLSPTKAAMTAAIENCIESGVAVYDLLAPDEPYKRQWCAHTTLVQDRLQSFTRLGVLYGGFALKGQRSAARLLKRAPVRLLGK